MCIYSKKCLIIFYYFVLCHYEAIVIGCHSVNSTFYFSQESPLVYSLNQWSQGHFDKILCFIISVTKLLFITHNIVKVLLQCIKL